ncbi:MAG: response regulator [Pseudomonadota bacterium]
MNTKNALILDDDQAIRLSLEKLVKREFLRPLLAADAKTALEILSQEEIDIVILDINLPDMDGLEVLKKIKEKKPECQVIVITGQGTREIAIQSLRRGAIDYLEKPIEMEEFSAALGRAQEQMAEREDLQYKNRLLVIDDEEAIVEPMIIFLKRKGYEVAYALNGKEGLKIIENSKVDVLITDINMGDMDGIEVLKRAKRLCPDIEGIMVTGFRDQELAIKSLRAGAIDYMVKPFNLGELLFSVERAIERINLNRDRLYRNRELKISSEIIAERKRAEEALRKSEEKYRTLFENVDEAVVVVQDGVIKFANPKGEELYGYSKKELASKSLTDFIYEEDREMVRDRHEKRPKGEKLPVSHPFRIIDRSGHTKWVELKVVLFSWEERPATLCLMPDITLRKQVEEERAQLISELQKKNEELERANQELEETTVQLVQTEKLSAIGELMAGVTHELNQPLNGIKIISQSMLRDIEKNRFEEEDVGNDLNDIVNQVNKMAEIIDHMRIYSRHTEGMPNGMIDVNTVIEGPFKLLDQQLKNHNIEVVRELAPDLPKLMGDPIRLEQVFMNLIINARNALESCGRENKRIEVRTYKTDNQGSAAGINAVAVEVKDNGEGVPEDLREKIFQPFFTTREPGKGTGLGLSVSSKIIEEHKGRFELESQVGEGTTFRVILPIAD